MSDPENLDLDDALSFSDLCIFEDDIIISILIWHR